MTAACNANSDRSNGAVMKGTAASGNDGVMKGTAASGNDGVIEGELMDVDGPAISILRFNEDPPPDLGPFAFPRLDTGFKKRTGRDDNGAVRHHEYNPATARIVSSLVACGASPVEIAIHLDIRPGQLTQHYQHELEHGAFPHNMQVAKTILDRAKLGDPRFALFWAKARMGWKEGSPPTPEDEGMLMSVDHLRSLVRRKPQQLENRT